MLHGKGQYVNDDGATTNAIESFWSLPKRAWKGTYHHMSDKHLHRYANEFVFRHNNRQSNDFATISLVFRGMVGRFLPYKKLVGPGAVYRFKPASAG